MGHEINFLRGLNATGCSRENNPTMTPRLKTTLKCIIPLTSIPPYEKQISCKMASSASRLKVGRVLTFTYKLVLLWLLKSDGTAAGTVFN